MDTLGFDLAVVVHAASIQDRDRARLVVERLRGRFERLALIGADGGYAGQLVEWVKEFSGWVLEIVTRPGRHRALAGLPRRTPLHIDQLYEEGYCIVDAATCE
jgi:putative transposase